MSNNVVSLIAIINERRAATAVAASQAAVSARMAAEKVETANRVADQLGGSAAAHVLGALVAEVQADQRANEQASRPMPAYCDPRNESRGAKYEATKNLQPAEISARIRADIKAAQKAGTIPAGCKIGVRLHSYSGGYSIDVRVTALPEGFRVTSSKYASWVKQFGEAKRCPLDWRECESEELRNLVAKLETIRAAYNRDNSDSMTDYFDVRYYGSAGVDWSVKRELEKTEIAASAGDYWAEECGR